jgi:hypothetical protein
MKLYRTISTVDEVPELLVYHCKRCSHTTTKQQKAASAVREGIK